MTSKKGSRNSRYIKVNLPNRNATKPTEQATGSSAKHSGSVSKDTTSSSKASPSTSKATSPTSLTASTANGTPLSNKKTLSESKATSPTNKATTSNRKTSTSSRTSKRPGNKATVPKSGSAMPPSDFPHMRRRFYIVRPEPNKTCVPMIALDELPAGFRLKGVPLIVTPQQINEWDMARVGADVVFQGSFEVECDSLPASQEGQQSYTGNQEPSSSKKAEASAEVVKETGEVNVEEAIEKLSKPDVSVNSENFPSAETSQVNSKAEGLASVLKLHQEVNKAVQGVVEKGKWEKANDHSKTQDAATPGVYGKKKYCTHWIRTGNCDYMQEGCRYLHVIPDAETRLTIGIRDMPRWAKEDLPSPPRASNSLRRRSWSPPKEKRDSQKDWRSRGNRKTHAELPAGPHLVSRVASERPSTPTPHSSFRGNRQGPQHGTMENGTAQALATTQVKAPTSQLPNINRAGPTDIQNGQQDASFDDPNIAAPQHMLTSAVPNQSGLHQPVQHGPDPQAPFSRHPQFPPSMPPTGSRSMPPPPPSHFYGGFSSPEHEAQSFGPPYGEGNYDPFQSQQSPRARPFDSPNLRNDGHRWGHPSHSPFGMNNYQYSQPQHTPPPGSPFGNAWRRGPFGSPAPSFSEASVGTIGHGRPGTSSPIIGTPILHKRLFRQPGQSPYVQAKPQPLGRSHKGKGGATYGAQDGNEGRSEELGNLISLDGEGNFGN